MTWHVTYTSWPEAYPSSPSAAFNHLYASSARGSLCASVFSLVTPAPEGLLLVAPAFPSAGAATGSPTRRCVCTMRLWSG